jgi:hypothetical protein
LHDRRLGHRGTHGGVDLGQHRGRRAFGGVHAVPNFHFKALKALLIECGHIVEFFVEGG